jgi:hypothetical protein
VVEEMQEVCSSDYLLNFQAKESGKFSVETVNFAAMQ